MSTQVLEGPGSNPGRHVRGTQFPSLLRTSPMLHFFFSHRNEPLFEEKSVKKKIRLDFGTFFLSKNSIFYKTFCIELPSVSAKVTGSKFFAVMEAECAFVVIFATSGVLAKRVTGSCKLEEFSYFQSKSIKIAYFLDQSF